MRKEARNDIQLKKQAFRTNIRKEWLQNHFQKIRDTMCQKDRFEEEIYESVRELVRGLPQTVMNLTQLMTEQKQAVTSIVSEAIEEVAERMVRMELVQWSHYVYILNQTIVNAYSLKEIEKIASHTLLSVLECGQIIMSKNRDNITNYKGLITDCLDYLFRICIAILDIDPMQQNALFDIMTRLWMCEHQMIDYERLLFVSVRILVNSYDSEQLENVSPQKLTDLQLMRIRFISTVFYKDTTVISNVVKNGIQISMAENGHRIHMLTLEFLINITKFLNTPAYYYPLLTSSILILIDKNLFPHNSCSREIIILTIRLLNNMLVNDNMLTQSILKEINLHNILNIFEVYQHEFIIQKELVQLFFNLIQFQNTNSQLIARLIMQGNIHLMMLELLSKMDEVEETFINNFMVVLVIMNNQRPLPIKDALLRYQNTLARIIEDSEVENENFEQMLKEIFEGQLFQEL